MHNLLETNDFIQRKLCDSSAVNGLVQIVVQKFRIDPVARWDLRLVHFLACLIEEFSVLNEVDTINAITLAEDDTVLNELALLKQVVQLL